jgi:hypothetical protein
MHRVRILDLWGALKERISQPCLFPVPFVDSQCRHLNAVKLVNVVWELVEYVLSFSCSPKLDNVRPK